MKYSIVIPAYNSGDWIVSLLDAITMEMNKITKDYEIVVVNDCSPNANTWSELVRAATRNTKIKAINLGYNVGQIRALICGIENSSGDFVITMDDDFQHQPNQISALINRMNETRSDVVIGQYLEKKDTGLRKFGSMLMNTIYFHVYNKPKHITSNSFRIFNKDIAKAVVAYRNNHPQFGPILFSITKKIDTVQIEHAERKYGKSGYSFSNMVHETIRSLLVSEIPFNFFCILSSFIIAIGLLFMVFGALQLWEMSAIGAGLIGLAVLGGFILFAVGVLGKYIIRCQEELIGPARYQIKNLIGEDHESKK